MGAALCWRPYMAVIETAKDVEKKVIHRLVIWIVYEKMPSILSCKMTIAPMMHAAQVSQSNRSLMFIVDHVCQTYLCCPQSFEHQPR